jgi:3-oxoacyl-[acyl-carrier protein] reductase
VLQADLTDEHEVDRLFAAARSALGRIDVCAAVAGVWPSQDVPVWELPLERWEHTVRQNLTSSFLTARGFLREVERNGHGSLVLVGSTAGLVGEAGHADYAAAKSAGSRRPAPQPEERGRAQSHRVHGVNAVAPGVDRDTDDTRARRPCEAVPQSDADDGPPQDRDAGRRRETGGRCSASDELSGHVTGQVVTVAGGMEGRVIHGGPKRKERQARLLTHRSQTRHAAG